MIIGVPKEIKDQEYRVALLPSAAYQLIQRAHKVVVERGAGAGSGYPDADYEQAGANLSDSHAEVFEQADLIVKVKEPQSSECPLLRSGQLLFTYLHLAADRRQADALIASGCTAIAYETVTDEQGGLPLLAPMSEVAGRLSIFAAQESLRQTTGAAASPVSTPRAWQPVLAPM